LILTNGTPEEPAKISLSICDISAAMYATTAVLQALFHREKYGEGQEIDVALLDCVLTWTGYFPYMYWYRGELPKRVGLHHHTMAPYGPYTTGDGREVIVAAGAGSRAAWQKFCQAIALPELVDDALFQTNALRLANRAALDARVSEVIGGHDRAYWLGRFHEFGIPAGALNDLGEALNHPRIQERGFIKNVDSLVGPIKVFDYPPQLSKAKSVNRLGPPGLGEHTAAILAELGHSEADVASLEQAAVVRCYAGGD
jgi:crotonobetainyl-CoA:carnitine CoA-transferase CaiB-like acyl-CoA transferase